MCGTNADSSPFNDFVGPDGILRANAKDFGYSWQITEPADSLNDWDYTKSNFHPDDVLDERFKEPSRERNLIKSVSLISADQAKDICSRNFLDSVLLDACILDVTKMGDASYANASALIKDLCASQCSFRGDCVGVNECQCYEGWSGADCSVSQCKNECGLHGSCMNGQCLCDMGWQGVNCTTIVSCDQVDNCTDLNHGVCIETNKCKCFSGYTGSNCNTTISCASLSECSGNLI